jgi:hypothetical protein
VIGEADDQVAPPAKYLDAAVNGLDGGNAMALDL